MRPPTSSPGPPLPSVGPADDHASSLPPLAWPGDVYACPLTGAHVATQLGANLRQRQALLTAAQHDPGLQRQLVAVAARSFPVFCGLWLWTEAVHEHTDAGRVERRGRSERPFVLWPIQVEAVREIDSALPLGQSVMWAKSRDMGATWVALAWTLHRALFTRSFKALWLSRKEDLVDQPGNPDSLFERLRYMLARLPPWMPAALQQPARKMHLSMVASGSVIDGESTNDEAGRGGRRDVVLVDEAAAITNLRAVDSALSANARTKIYISTPKRGSHFGMIRRTGVCRVVAWPWWTHPAMGRGRELVDAGDGRGPRWSSPWYRAEVAKTIDAQSVAENLDMDDEGGDGVFDPRTLDAHLASYAHPPHRGGLRLPRPAPGVRHEEDLQGDRRPMVQWHHDTVGAWRWWPRGGAMVPGRDGLLRPNQRHGYVFGVDVGMGLGASDSVLTAIDADTGFKVARYSTNTIAPAEFGDLIHEAGRWFGGRGGVPLLVVESNGPGQATLLRLRQLGYPRLYRHRDRGTVRVQISERYGWHSSRETKRAAIELYRAALGRHEIKNPDREALDQCRAYVYFDAGGVGPIALGQLTAEQRAQHGDMVVADMLAYLGLGRAPLGDFDNA